MKAGWNMGMHVQRKGAREHSEVGVLIAYEGEGFYLVRVHERARELVCHEDDLELVDA